MGGLFAAGQDGSKKQPADNGTDPLDILGGTDSNKNATAEAATPGVDDLLSAVNAASDQQASKNADDAKKQEKEQDENDVEAEPILVPYLEVYYKGSLIYSSWKKESLKNSQNLRDSQKLRGASSDSTVISSAPPNEYYGSDTCVPFGDIRTPALDGDMLVRVRHFDKATKQSGSAFRLCFNTHFIGKGRVLRSLKAGSKNSAEPDAVIDGIDNLGSSTPR